MKKNKVIITGTGRSGTTFLMKLFTDLGLDTGYSKGAIESFIFKECNAGLESYYRKVLKNDETTPYVVKSPRFSKDIDTLIQDYNLDLVIVPKRKMDDVVKSRIKQGKNKPGGSYHLSDPEELKDYLERKQDKLFSDLKKYSVPHVILDFPKCVKEPKYLYKKLHTVLKNTDYKTFKKSFSKIRYTSDSDYYKKDPSFLNWRAYLRVRPDLKKNWDGPFKSRLHYIIFRNIEIILLRLGITKENNMTYFLNPINYRKRKKKPYAQSKNPQVKILFFGITRSVKYTLPFIEKNIFNVLDKANIPWNAYIHCYDQKTVSNTRSGEYNIHLDHQKDIALLGINKDKVRISSREEFLESIDIASYTTHGDPYKNNGDKAPFKSLKNLLSQLHSLQTVTNLLKPSKDEKCAYIFVRPDLAYLDPLPVDVIQKCIDKQDEPLIYTPEWQEWNGLNDRFAITNAKGALLYGNRFDSALSYSQNKPLHAENFLHHTISKYNHTGLISRALRVRANGGINKIDFEYFNLDSEKISRLQNSYLKQC